MNYAGHGVAHTTSVLETDGPNFYWHIVGLPPSSTKRCWAMQAITRNLCNAKVRIGKHGTSRPTYKVMKKKFHFTNNVEHEFWSCHDNIKRCVSGNKSEYVMD